MTLNRLINLLSVHTSLNSLSLHFPANAIYPPILPLAPHSFTLPELTFLSVSGAAPLTTLLNALRVPALASLSLALERGTPANMVGDPPPVLEEAISSLLLRSGTPAVTTLCISFPTAIYYNDFPVAGQPAPWSYFQHTPHVTTLKVSHATLEPLLNAIGIPGVPGVAGLGVDDDLSDDGIMPPLGGVGGMGGALGMGVAGGPGGAWLLPELENLELRSCHSSQSHTPYAHGPGGVVTEIGVKKFIEVVGARNPVTGGTGGVGNPLPIPIAIAGGAGPTSRLKRLHVHDCFSIGTDVHAWLRDRVEEFAFTEPTLINHRYVVSYPLHPHDYEAVGVVFV